MVQAIDAPAAIDRLIQVSDLEPSHAADRHTDATEEPVLVETLLRSSQDTRLLLSIARCSMRDRDWNAPPSAGPAQRYCCQ